MLDIFCDNCCGQNKNNFMLQFLHWISYEKQLIKSIKLNFLLKDHTKHNNDRAFGLISN